MRASQFLIKTFKETPKSFENRSAILLVQGGYVDQVGTGIYTFLPLGLRVLDKINTIIREEMNKIGGQEILMPALHPASYWKTTNRWKIPVGFKTKSQTGQEYVLGWTHEEIVTPLVKKYIKSYKDLPIYIYQIQTKFRDEERAKSGLLRTRELVMKDLYSFHKDEKDLNNYYEKVKEAYQKIIKRLGLGDTTYYTYALGGDFSKYSHEFQTITDAGEDTIYICEKCSTAVNKEIVNEMDKTCPECQHKELKEAKAIEIANIFKLKERFSKAFDLKYLDSDDKEKYAVMGCYGFGSSRVMGAIAEVFSDEKGLVWPKNVAPFQVYLMNISAGCEGKKVTEDLYNKLEANGAEVLYDDRDKTAGFKFTEADLIGIPLRLTISGRSLAKNSVEIKERSKKEAKLVKIDKVLKEI